MVHMTVSDITFKYLQHYLAYRVEKEYMSAQLALTLQDMNNPLHMAVVYEAGVFAGFQTQEGIELPPSDPWQWVNTLSILVRDSIQMGIEAYTLYSLLESAGITRLDTRMTVGNATLIGLSLAPAVLRLCYPLLYAWDNAPMPALIEEKIIRREEIVLRQFTENENKQELVLFGLRGWILNRWDTLRRRRIDLDCVLSGAPSYIDIGLEVVEQVISNGFYVLLAVKAIPTTLTLGAINTHRGTIESLLNNINRWKWQAEGAFQLPFNLAAYFSMLDGPEQRDPGLDYEQHRVAGGMHIEVRDLGYTYPGADQPALEGVNLVLEPGECLAIVGFNGGGKTTLVKTLLGLNNHSGTLRINGHPIEDYDPDTLHKRMSCLFQDYSRYNLSLRMNVGIGEVSRMDDDAAIDRALERGGAMEIRSKLGSLEARLDPSGGARDENEVARGGGDDDTSSNDDAQEVEAAIELGQPAVATSNPEKADPSAPTASTNKTSGSNSPSPDADDTWVDTQYGLSGGQWQRVGLSRAFMRADSADLVVFDEPSASLDPRAEAELFDRIHALSVRGGQRATTTIFISHRFSTVRRADKIAFVADGKIIEYGTHAELMARKGKYEELFTLQRSGYGDD